MRCETSGCSSSNLPRTQAYKKKRVRDVFGELPGHVTYVPIDFAQQSLDEVLNSAEYDRKKKTIFIWEGVTMYISESAVDATLRAVVRIAAPGSHIVFDYFLDSALQARASVLREVAKNVAAVGEPFVFGVPGQDGTAFVQARGLRVVSDFGSADSRRSLLTEKVQSAHAVSQPSVHRRGAVTRYWIMNRRRFTQQLAAAVGAISLGRTLRGKGASLAPALAVDGERINRQLRELAQFGKNPYGGVSRVAYSEFDRPSDACRLFRARRT